MKQRISPYQFDDHREFIRQALKEGGFSYASFAAKHADIASRPLLAFALSKGRSGSKSKPMRNFSPETLARIGKALKLSDAEIDYLLLLLWDNNSEVLGGPYGSAYADAIKRLINSQKSRHAQSTNKQATSKSHYSQTAQAVAQLLDTLPPHAKQRLSREILSESRVALARQRNKAGVKTITSVIERLGELVALGAP